MGTNHPETTITHVAGGGLGTRAPIPAALAGAALRPMAIALALSLLLAGFLLAGTPRMAWANGQVTAGASPDLTSSSDQTTCDDLVRLILLEDQWQDVVAEDTVIAPKTRMLAATRAATPSFNTTNEALNYLREQMSLRKATITFNIPSSQPKIDRDAIFVECSDPHYGDYLRANTDTMSVSQAINSTTREYTFRVTYLTTAAQEQRFDQELSYLARSLRLNTISSNTQKVYVIYNWICSNVKYAYGSKDIYYSAYSALCCKQAVCQGNAALFYRLARAAGLNARCVVGWTTQGTGSYPDHMWNIVKIGSAWYHLDSTWDGAITSKKYQWFLKTQTDFLKAIGKNGHTAIDWGYNNAKPAASQQASKSFVRVGSKSATCTVAGCKTHYQLGTAYYTETLTSTSKAAVTLTALGHNPSAWRVYRAATTKKTGLQRRVCTRCGAVLATKTIPVVKPKTKAANGLVVKAKASLFRVAYNNKKAVNLGPGKLMTIAKAHGKVTFAKAAGTSAGISVSKIGTVTVPRLTKRGVYTVKIKVTASGDATHKSASKVVTFKVQVK